jgi:serine protease Do
MVHGIMTQLIETGKVSRGFIGVSIQGLDASMAKAFKAPDTTGALISGVEPGTPGAKAGLKPGDIIRSLDGNPVRDPRTLRLAVASAKPGTKINLKIWRDGSEQTIPVTLEELRAENQTAQAQPVSRSALNGVNVEALTPAIAQQLGVGPQTQGVVVTSVAPDSQAYQAGLRRGDVIEEIGQSPVRSAGAFRDAVAKAGAGPVLLLVNRRGNTLFVAIESNQ